MDFNDDALLLSEILAKLVRAQERKLSEDHPQQTTAPALPTEESSKIEPTKEKKKRCGCCNKKLGLITFPCKCGGEFCALHRSSEDHTCSYDYHADAKRALSTMLVKVEAKKVDVL